MAGRRPRHHDIGRDLKGKSSAVGYIAAIAFAFVVPSVSYLLYLAFALVWLVPDRRIEARLEQVAEK